MRYRKRGEVNYWMSYADLMSAMLMVFALLLMVVILDYRELLEKKEKQIKEVVSVKTEIIQALTEEFKKSNMSIEIDQQTGAIRFPGSILFKTNSSEISEEGKVFLKKFIPKYLGILLQDRFRNEISSIIIEGHTDKQGTYMYNMSLSQARAYSVLAYIYGDQFPNFKERELSKKYITANGRSFSSPLTNEKGQYDPERSRRVEFLFRLKEDEAIKAIEKLVNE
ncbi:MULTISPECIES: OmpA/MotB family protein [Anoxybacillus]|uniref:OmpA/MotB family protein n=1 Tax=Anoxybacillus TaxID=150247 RepID=UPI000B49C444|nr:OmpA family protein [Anoxybacillus flavithermus]ASA95761.1 flagellar motor protein MotB [Anoxybacillus flavithermus]MBE2911653.1 OmpA family protein [Anoxybacillus flavithermus]MBE2917114.1 OmpA family protein [Anoxybacillus flavithermus]